MTRDEQMHTHCSALPIYIGLTQLSRGHIYKNTIYNMQKDECKCALLCIANMCIGLTPLSRGHSNKNDDQKIQDQRCKMVKSCRHNNQQMASLCQGPVPSLEDHNPPCRGLVPSVEDHYNKNVYKYIKTRLKYNQCMIVKFTRGYTVTGVGPFPFQYFSSTNGTYVSHDITFFGQRKH